MKKTMITALLVVLGLIILGGGIYGITTVLSDNTIIGPQGPEGPEGPEGPIGPTGERGSTIWKRDITSNGNESISIPTPVVHNMRVGDLVITTDNYVYRINSISSSTILLTLEIAFNPPTPPEISKPVLLFDSDINNEFYVNHNDVMEYRYLNIIITGWILYDNSFTENRLINIPLMYSYKDIYDDGFERTYLDTVFNTVYFGIDLIDDDVYYYIDGLQDLDGYSLQIYGIPYDYYD